MLPLKPIYKYLENEKILNKLFPIDSVKTIKDYSFVTAYKEYLHTSKVGNRFVFCALMGSL